MLEFGYEVFGGYRIASMPYQDKSDAYDDIRLYWNGADVTTYFDSNTHEWYIVAK